MLVKNTIVVNLRVVGSVNLVTTDFNPLLVASYIAKSAIGTVIGIIKLYEPSLRLSIFIHVLTQRIKISCYKMLRAYGSDFVPEILKLTTMVKNTNMGKGGQFRAFF
jgi:hypothetical protein